MPIDPSFSPVKKPPQSLQSRIRQRTRTRMRARGEDPSQQKERLQRLVRERTQSFRARREGPTTPGPHFGMEPAISPSFAMGTPPTDRGQVFGPGQAPSGLLDIMSRGIYQGGQPRSSQGFDPRGILSMFQNQQPTIPGPHFSGGMGSPMGMGPSDDLINRMLPSRGMNPGIGMNPGMGMNRGMSNRAMRPLDMMSRQF